jgi:hypothetical protein
MGYYLRGYGFNFSRNKATKILVQLQANIFFFIIFVLLRVHIAVILQVIVTITHLLPRKNDKNVHINVETHILFKELHE